MSVAFTLVALWLAFAATHMGLSSLTLRPRIVAVVGEGPFALLYSIVALAIFVPLVSVYFENQHAGPHLWYLGPGAIVRGSVYAGMVTALSLVVGGLFRPPPSSMAGARSAGEAEVRGVLRVTRHPVLMGAGLFGAVHLLGANVNAAEAAFFAGFPIFAVVGCMHQDARKRETLGEPYRRLCEQTSLLPFGRGGLTTAVGEAYLPIAIAVVLTVVLRVFHPQWFGGAI